MTTWCREMRALSARSEVRAASGDSGRQRDVLSATAVAAELADVMPAQATFCDETVSNRQPFVNLLCYQNGVLVAEGWKGYFAEARESNYNFVLRSGAWQSGAADCTAWLDMATRHGWKQLASTSFHVYA